MNQRIQELATEAGAGWDDKYHWYVGSVAMEKFAELIVNECSDLFEVEWGDEKLTGNDVGYVLKKHFGVE